MANFHHTFNGLNHMHTYDIDDVITELKKLDEQALFELRKASGQLKRYIYSVSDNLLPISDRDIELYKHQHEIAQNVRKAHNYVHQLKKSGEQSINLDPRRDLITQLNKLCDENTSEPDHKFPLYGGFYTPDAGNKPS